MRLGLALALGASFVRGGGGPAPDPDLTVPDPGHNKGLYLPAGPFWQDTARTVPATTTGDPVKAWDDASGDDQHGTWQSGAVATLAAGGGVDLPAGSIWNFPCSVAGTSWSFYAWSDAPNPAALNFLFGTIASAGPTIAPLHTTGDTYFGGAAGGPYPTIVDTSAEKLRGMAVAGTVAECFVGGSQVQLGFGTANSVPDVKMNAEIYTEPHVVRFLVLRDVADGLEITNAYRRYVLRLLSPVNPAWPVRKVAVVLHTEGKEPGIAAGGAYSNAIVLARARLPFSRWSIMWSPGYELSSILSAAASEAALKKIFHASRDRLGLHTHWIEDLCDAAGVTYVDHPTISGALVPDGATPAGYFVLCSAHGSAALTSIIDKGLDVVEAYGLGRPTVFVAGNYLCNSDLRTALAANAITHDLSAISSELTTGYAAYEQSVLAAEWPSVLPETQPYANGPIRQACIIGMCGQSTPTEISDRLEALADGEVGVVHCHENQTSDISDLVTALETYEAWCLANSKTLVYVTANEL